MIEDHINHYLGRKHYTMKQRQQADTYFNVEGMGSSYERFKVIQSSIRSKCLDILLVQSIAYLD
jgi:hypothetical protein